MVRQDSKVMGGGSPGVKNGWRLKQTPRNGKRKSLADEDAGAGPWADDSEPLYDIISSSIARRLVPEARRMPQCTSSTRH